MFGIMALIFADLLCFCNFFATGTVLIGMRYWAYLASKLLIAASLFSAGWYGLHAVWPRPQPFMRVQLDPFARDLGYTVAVMTFGLLALGVIYIILLDQRFRCRTCLRRLRMPVTSGGWNQWLMGPPRTDYICPYGHGTLRIPEVNIGGTADPNWKPIDDMWKELEELGPPRK